MDSDHRHCIVHCIHGGWNERIGVWNIYHQPHMILITADSNDAPAECTYITMDATQRPLYRVLPRTFYAPPESRTPSGGVMLVKPNPVYSSTRFNY